MLTLFSTPKPFLGHIGLIQRNAVQSWLRLQPRPEIILFGREPGTAEIAAELNLRHEPGVTTNEFGTPLVSDMYMRAQALAHHELICYVNGDIILMSDFPVTVAKVAQRRATFLLVGRRWDLDLSETMGFEEDWELRLRERVQAEGRLHEPTGIDYFVFRRGQWKDIPPFAVGRVGYDNWLLYDARRKRWPLVDMSGSVMVVHQNHNYGHLAQGLHELLEGPEAKRNMEIVGGAQQVYTIEDATWLMRTSGPVRAWTKQHFRRRWNWWLQRHGAVHAALRTLRGLVRKVARGRRL